jgi:hypothetical protein
VANISVTYTFSNGTVADATAVNQNFTDIINGTSDGTKDMSIAALTVAGTATLNGAVNLGNATGDDITVTGLVASDFKPKTDATYNLGSTTLGWLGLYLGKNSNRVLLKNNDSASASWTYTFPVNAGVAGQTLVNQGSGTQAWKYACVDTAAKSADYTITDTDMILHVLMTTAASDRTVTLPTAADNPNRIIKVTKVDSGAGTTIIDGEGAETISGAATIVLNGIYATATLQCDGTGWNVLSRSQQSLTSGSIGTGINCGAITNIGSLAVTPGKWLLIAITQYNGASGPTYYSSFLSTTTASTSGTTNGIDAGIGMVISSNGVGSNVKLTKLIQITSTTTYYLNCSTQGSQAASSGGILGSITAIPL